MDDTPSPSGERGVVKWMDPADVFPSDCEWTMGVAPGPNHVFTAHISPDPSCPDVLEAVGVGYDFTQNTPEAKFNVYTRDCKVNSLMANDWAGTDTWGLEVRVQNGTLETQGVHIDALAAGNNFNYGGFFNVHGQTVRSRGVSARSTGATLTGMAGEFLASDAATWTLSLIHI